MNIKNTFLELSPWLGGAHSVETCVGVKGRLLASRAVRAWQEEKRGGREVAVTVPIAVTPVSH